VKKKAGLNTLKTRQLTSEQGLQYPNKTVQTIWLKKLSVHNKEQTKQLHRRKLLHAHTLKQIIVFKMPGFSAYASLFP